MSYQGLEVDRKMQKAVFFDRDGVINKDKGYVYQPQDFFFTDGIFELCLSAQKQGFLLFIITNQSGIARGYYTEKDFLLLNDWMLARFEEQGVKISKVYYCPFHPKKGIGRYKADSYDRKPNPGMILKAKDEFCLDLSKSILVGDKDSDMEAGRRAGVGKLMLLPGKYEYARADDVYVVKNLRQARQFMDLYYGKDKSIKEMGLEI